MKKIVLVLFLVPFLLFAQDVEKSTLTKEGQTVPTFKVKTIDGKTINIKALRGKVVLINFFATWCGPCMNEMPRVEKELWEKYRKEGLVVVAIGRGHNQAELLKFKKEKGFTFPIAPDAKRQVYGLFATNFIPRNYVIDREGKIVLG